MTTILTLAAWLIYAVGWFAGTVVGARWFASHMDACQVERWMSGYLRCKDTHIGGGHWRGDGTVGFREMWSAAIPALIWPVALVPRVVMRHAPQCTGSPGWWGRGASQ